MPAKNNDNRVQQLIKNMTLQVYYNSDSNACDPLISSRLIKRRQKNNLSGKRQREDGSYII